MNRTIFYRFHTETAGTVGGGKNNTARLNGLKRKKAPIGKTGTSFG